MTDNQKPPAPEDMGAHLDDQIKETVHDWADRPEGADYEDLNKRIDQKLRRTLAGWVGADENADWKTIGANMDSRTRNAIAKWVGAQEGADWPTISGRIENRTRYNIARLVRAGRAPQEGAPVEPAEATWSDIGTKIERDVRSWLASAVGTEKDADWNQIGTQMFEQVRTAFDKVVKAARKTGETPPRESTRIEIEGGEAPPAVKSEEPIQPPEA